ncbi:MAG TPA: aminotransferase class V-fold PLP-dependent enzyme [Vicinamibacterales bacterium]|nr:aminotransferase class V-fold PLP-dependent enzyme [Vicinamibacterales bacterium]
MLQSLKKTLSRRDLFRWSALLTAPALLQSRAAGEAQSRAQPPPRDVYRAIGVRPLINARGTFTIISGSLMLPEVRTAMDAAAQQHVHLDELMAAIGARLAELTKAEWGMVSSGCAAALTHATAACVAGGNPDLHIRIPNLSGFAKDEVIIPRHSRNVYDAAVRAVGVRIVDVGTAEELEAAFGPRTAMVYILAGPNADSGPLSTKAICAIARQKQVPVLVDAAAEVLTVPNVHLENGATLVGYSGGKCLRGPQSAGLLLGRKDLVQAAWIHSAPHHGFARSMKVGKEEAIAMLTAVEMWTRRDHQAEWNRWLGWLDHIARHVSRIDGVTTAITETTELSNRTPALSIRWDAARLGVTGAAVARHLMDTEPRIATPGGRDRDGLTSISVTPYQMSAGDEKIVAARIHDTLARPPKSIRIDAPAAMAAPAADLSGRWNVRIEYVAAASTHALHLKQTGNRVDGTHQGDFVSRDLAGTIDGDRVQLSSSYGERNGDALSFRFNGTVTGNEMAGSLDMGEYLTAKWTARRHEYRRG